MLSCAIGRGGGKTEVGFALHVRNDNCERTPPLVQPKALCGREDDGTPVITVMLEGED
jgi:hypothetical protein